jgi:hypothetical protein
MLDAWRTLPLVIKGRVAEASVPVASVMDLLRDNNRVCQIDLSDNFTI